MPDSPIPLRFVVLEHTGYGERHFDIMFETSPGSPLRTWRSPIWPAPEPVELVRLNDHRRAYLQYEGAVSNNRGVVRRVASGELVTLDPVDNTEGDTIRGSRLRDISSGTPNIVLFYLTESRNGRCWATTKLVGNA